MLSAGIFSACLCDTCGIIIIQFDVRKRILKMLQSMRLRRFYASYHSTSLTGKKKTNVWHLSVEERDVKSKHTRKIICLLVNKY